MADFIIIGGGVIGLLTAYELNRAGAKVSILERNKTGKESSWAGGGILSPLYPWRYPTAVTALASWSQQNYASFCNMLFTETGIDPQWQQNGLLMLDSDEQKTALQWAAANNKHLAKLRPDDTLKYEPLTIGGESLWMPKVAQVRNPRLLKSLKIFLQRKGVSIQENCDVKEIITSNNIATGVKSRNETIASDNIVVAGGAWSAKLLEQFNTGLKVEPVRGQMLLFKTPPRLISRIVMHKGHYVIPRRDGYTLVGSTVEHAGFSKETTIEAFSQLHKAALNIIPSLADYPVETHWAGLRPGSPEGVPFICRHPSIENLYINSGHFRNGVVLGPASARLLVDIMLRRSPIVDPTPYEISEN